MQQREKARCEEMCPCSEDCQTHRFRLRALLPMSRALQETSVAFCPVFFGNQRSGHTRPESNLDGNHFTPAFTIGVDRHYNDHNRLFELESFRKRVERACVSSTELCFPQPQKNSLYCNNCKRSFDDYFNHINAEEHLANTRRSVANSFIEDLCRLYPQPSSSFLKKNKAYVGNKVVSNERPRRCKTKVVFEGSTLATRKSKQERAGETLCRVSKHKGILKTSDRKMTLRNYQPLQGQHRS